MVLWFVILSVLGVRAVFRDERMDFRFVALGAVLPDAVDGSLRRGVGPLHGLPVGVTLLFAVVVSTIGRRTARKRWLGVPIGVFSHQVLDGAWLNTYAFWWPFKGLSFAGRLPVVEHGLVVGLLEEGIGLTIGWWAWRAFGLADPEIRAELFRSGHLLRRRNPGRRHLWPQQRR